MYLNFRPVLVVIILLFFSVFFVSCQYDEGIEKNNNYGNGRKHQLGLIPEDTAQISKKIMLSYKSKFISAAAMPASIDLSGNCPPVGDQGHQGSCVAWATGYALKTYQEKIEEKWDISTSNHEFSPSWIYNQINGGIDHGSKITDALGLIVEHGCDTLEGFPYIETNYTRKPDALSLALAEKYKASSWTRLSSDVDTIKNMLIDGNPVVFQTAIYPDFDSLDTSNPIYDNTSGNLSGYHALCIVGYDDSKRAFKFINSWGTDWGIDGYGWITYNFITPNNPINFIAYRLSDNKNAQGISIQGNPMGYCFYIDNYNQQGVVFKGSGDTLQKLWYNGSWNQQVLRNDILGDPYIFASNGQQTILYRGYQNMLHKLWSSASNSWNHEVFSYSDVAGNPMGYTWVNSNSYIEQRIVYRASDNTLHILWNNGSWNHQVLRSDIAGDPYCYVWNGLNGQQIIVYRGTDNMLHKLSYSAGNSWNHEVFSYSTVTGNPMGYNWANTNGYNQQAIVYRSPDYTLHKLWYDGTWHHEVLRNDTAGDPYGYVWNGQQTIAYRGTDNLLHNLWYSGSNGWNHEVFAYTSVASNPKCYIGNTQGNYKQQVIVYRAFDNTLRKSWYENIWHYQIYFNN